ncbi:short-chain dehydrogenase [Intrasporangium chromatireducens Q5-1]|uniref:Short-chain dehydrogenase n=1 Tax=Intrasporangium chromatireducens Q5-1 TaxID=584657 RepID=W9GGI2_9MICO|nr:SDR family oxidoreductase [Intrasporangium chromatireducens]EWT05346.1 short-chain dehydrogenase [Intrasporangium chromatireducens Q5-1]
MSDFDGMVALVTGGASGIGAAIAAELSCHRARVAVLDRDTTTAAPGLFAVRADVTSEDAVAAAVQQVVDHFGHLDVLVNNAGIGAQGTVEGNELSEWQAVLDVNLLGMVRVTRACLPHLRRSTAAAVVNTASVAAEVGLPDRVLYSASKGAVVAASRAMAADLIDDGIRVCWVSPGTADTPWIGRLLSRAEDPAAERAALEARQPHGRLVSAQEVADAVCYLAGPRAGSTTGVGLTIDGGLVGLRLRR